LRGVPNEVRELRSNPNEIASPLEVASASPRNDIVRNDIALALHSLLKQRLQPTRYQERV